MLVRPEREAEFAAIDELVRLAFQTAPHADGDEHEFVTRLRAGPEYLPELALVVSEEERPVAYLMMTRLVLRRHEISIPVAYLALVCVQLDHRERGYGVQLVREGLSRAGTQGYPGVLVYGDPAYYRRFGFRPSGDFGIVNTNGFDAANVMAIELFPGGLLGTPSEVTLPS